MYTTKCCAHVYPDTVSVSVKPVSVYVPNIYVYVVYIHQCCVSVKWMDYVALECDVIAVAVAAVVASVLPWKLV